MKYRFPLSFILCLSVAVMTAAGTWRMHPTFDGEVTHVIETPDYVYFTSRTLPANNGLTPNYISLFRYDKEGDDITALSATDCLSTTALYEVMRNPEKGYILTLGSDYSIDLIHDDGKATHIPSYKMANVDYSKNVNAITPDRGGDRVYLATNFGYIELNDKKGEIADSRIYGEALKGVAHIGNNILLLRHNQLVSARADEPRFSIEEYKNLIDLYVPIGLYPISNDKCAVITNGGAPHLMYIVTLDDNGDAVLGEPFVGNFFSAEYIDEGLLVSTPDVMLKIPRVGEIEFITRPADEKSGRMISRNFRDFYVGEARKGLRRLHLDTEKGWEVTSDYALPNAPAPFISDAMVEHPTYGLLVSNFAKMSDNTTYEGKSPELISGYKMGQWKNFTAPYTAPELPTIIEDPYGITIDPDNPDYVYLSSLKSGLARINLTDPYDIIHFANPSNPASGTPGFIPFLPDIASIDNWSTSMSYPRLDYYGNLWSAHANYDLEKEQRTPVYCWTPADRAATTSPSDVHPPLLFYLEGVVPGHRQNVYPLTTNRNRNILLCIDKNYNSSIVVIDTNGTPTDFNDDRQISVTEFIDQDGGSVDCHTIAAVYEDKATGNVWIGHDNGVFYFDPLKVIKDNKRVSRIKVARNDGTNLADYLLNGVRVTDIISDNNGNKWFGTIGAGLVSTTSDGKTILETHNKDGGFLPSDDINKLGYFRENNSLMVSTREGLCEYYLQDSNGKGNDNEVKVYPNPVRPDYMGYVTIDGLGDGSLVKIVDAGGNVVKEIGPVSGTTAEWDRTNLHFQTVSSGVYFILAMSGDNNSSYSQVGKVLVVR